MVSPATTWAERDATGVAAAAVVVPSGARARYRRNVEELAACQKPSRGAPLYSQYVNRPLGRRIAAAAEVAGLRPDQVSWLSFAGSAAAIAVLALARPTPLVGVVAAALLLVAYATDSADGQLARLRGGGTLAGEWLDHVLDVVKISGLHLAVAVAALRFDRGLGRWPLVAALVFELVAVVSFFSLILTDQLRSQAGVAPRDRAVFHGWRRVLSLPTDWGVQCLWFATWGWAGAFVAGYGVLAVAGAGHVLLSNRARFRDLAARGAS